VTTLRPAQDGATVTAVVVAHEGERWLPAVLDGLARQTRRPDRVVATDTGSTDRTTALLRDRLGDGSVHDAPPRTSFGAAVRLGLEAAAGPEDGDTGWVWLLHDDSAPAPDALERLLAVARDHPTAAILGPKLREWPALRRLLEVGVTLTGTGTRETGLERGEYDQGQHDRVRDVLAVNTAGMLVRRSVLADLGFDERLPLFGNDLDLGWRAARAGHRTVVAPDAVVFHAEAAHRGLRRGDPARRPRRGERAAALYTLLVNCSALAFPFVLVRLFVGSLVRALGLLLVRAPGDARDELVALAGTYLRPLRIASGRRSRRRSRRRSPDGSVVPAREVRHLLAPWWVPYRRGLDVLGDLAGAVAHSAGDLTAARRSRSLAPAGAAETGPVPAEAQSLPPDSGLVARLLASPVAWVFTALVVASLVAARGLFGHGLLAGGALLPAPDSAQRWWHTYLASYHLVGVGSTAPAAPYLLPLAVLGTVLLGKAWLVVDVLFLLAVPLAAVGGFRFLRRVTGSLPASVWGAVAYGVLPVVTGAVQEGRLGTVAGTVILPWLAHAASFLGTGETRDRRTRAAWRTALWLALLTAFVPIALPLAVAVAAVGFAAAARRGDARATGPLLLTALVAAVVLLLPWSWATWSSGGPVSWLFEAGLPAPALTRPVTRWDVVLGRPGAGAPGWVTAGVVVAALAALLRPDTRPSVLRAWTVLALGLVATALLAGRTFAAPGTGVDQPLWLGFPLVVVQGSAICAAALAGTGIRRRLSGSSFGWRQPLGVLVVLLAVLSPVAAGLWWLWTGSDDPLDRTVVSGVPTYMTDAAAENPLNGVLVVRGSRDAGFRYALLRGPGIRLGDDTVRSTDRSQAAVTRRVANLATAPQPADLAALQRHGVFYIYAPAPADVSLVGNLDSVSGVTPASAARGARAWQLEGRPTDAALPRLTDPARPWLLAVQLLAIVTAVVLAAPSRKGRR
jgi:GT2 family glycosyltransferase